MTPLSSKLGAMLYILRRAAEEVGVLVPVVLPLMLVRNVYKSTVGVLVMLLMVLFATLVPVQSGALGQGQRKAVEAAPTGSGSYILGSAACLGLCAWLLLCCY
jgi:hypothetical protein